MDNIYRIAISVQNIRHFRLLPVLAGLLLGFSTVHAQERDSTYSADTSRLTINARNELTGGMVLPELMIPEEEMTAYSREKISAMMNASISPMFYSALDIKPYYTAIHSFNGMMQEHYGMMPLTGSLHAFLGRRDMDWTNLYRYQSAYMAAGVQLAPWLEVNGGGIFGMSMPKDMMPAPVFGGMMSVVIRPSESTSMMIWGSYTDTAAFGPPTFNPVSVPRLNIGASAKFRIGDATIGVGASFSTTP